MSFTVRRLRNILRPGNRFLQRLTVSFMGFSHSFFHHHNRLSQRASPPQRGTTTIYQMSTFSLGFLSPTPLFLFFDRTAVIHDNFFFSCSPSVLSMSSRRGIPHLPFILIFLFFSTGVGWVYLCFGTSKGFVVALTLGVVGFGWYHGHQRFFFLSWAICHGALSKHHMMMMIHLELMAVTRDIGSHYPYT